MSSFQRRRGDIATIYRSEDTTDRRGNTTRTFVTPNPHRVRATVVPERSARAELPGQVAINVIKIIVPADLPDVDLYSRVEFDGKVWDVVTPPALRKGTKHTRHWSISLRQRPA